MSIFDTLLLYNFILILSLLLTRKSNVNKYGVYAIFVVFMLTACRFDIGNDYANQYKIWDTIAVLWKYQFPLSVILIQTQEIATILLAYIFQWANHPALYIFAIHGLVFFYFLYRSLKENDCIASGIFALFTLLYIFYSWDWTRQGVAYAIGLYSIKYVKNGQFKSFMKCVLLAFCFHTSAMILVLLYPLRYFNIKKNYAIIFIVLFTIFGYAGILDGAATYLINNINIPFYSNYQGAAHSLQFVKMSSGIVVLFKALISIVIIVYIPANEPVLRNCVTLGTIFYIISSQNLLIERVSYYFMIAQLISLKYLFIRSGNSSKILLKVVVVGVLMLFFNYAIVNVGGTRGAVPYDSIFSENCQKEDFRFRVK